MVPRAASASGAGRTRVCVVGHEGVAAATAGHLALLGFDVAWTSARSGSLAAYAERGGVELVGGVVSGSGRPRIEPSLDRAVRGADLVLLCTHATEHAAYATLLAPVLADGQAVLLTPGRTGGALEFARRLAAVACRARIVLGETETAVYVPMGQGPGRVEILVEKHEIRASAFPATDTSRLLDLLHGLYPQVAGVESVLDTSIANVGGVVHPAAMLLNPQVTEQAAAGADLVYYQDQVNRTLADLVMEPLDAERVAVGRALGLRSVPTFVEWSRACFGTRRRRHPRDGLHQPRLRRLQGADAPARAGLRDRRGAQLARAAGGARRRARRADADDQRDRRPRRRDVPHRLPGARPHPRPARARRPRRRRHARARGARRRARGLRRRRRLPSASPVRMTNPRSHTR